VTAGKVGADALQVRKFAFVQSRSEVLDIPGAAHLQGERVLVDLRNLEKMKVRGAHRCGR
jgi:hypothetical protein